MKVLSKLFLVLVLIGTLSCRDTKKEEETMEEDTTEVAQEVDVELDSISENVNKEMNELEDAVKALDSI